MNHPVLTGRVVDYTDMWREARFKLAIGTRVGKSFSLSALGHLQVFENHSRAAVSLKGCFG